MKLTRRAIIISSITPFIAKAQQPIKIVGGFAVGGTLDPVARLLSDHMAKSTGKSFIFEAMPGAGGGRAGEFVAKSAPDGNTLLIGNIASIVLTPLTFQATKYDPRNDFTPLAYLTDFQIALSVSKTSGINTLGDLIAYVKANPEKAVYGIPATGSLPHLLGLELERIAGVKMTAVAYRGTAQIVTDMAGGHLLAGITAPIDVLSQHKGGLVKTIAMTGVKRNHAFGDVPTFNEAGLKGLEKNGWQAILAPAGMDKQAAETLSKAIIVALKDPSINTKLVELGFDVVAGDGAALLKRINEDYATYAPLIERSGLRQ
jgi:tripartite-type tricarboxylate transporter receptor subunit TctC